MESPESTKPQRRRLITLDDLSIKRTLPGGTTDTLFRPTKAQAPYLLATDPNLFLWGNRGGGKSYCARWHAHAMALKHPGLKYFIVRRSYTELQKTHLAEIPGELDRMGGEKLGYKWTKNDHIISYPNGSLGFYAQYASEDDTRKVLGAEAGLIVFDESPELQWDWLMLMAASARVPKSLGITPMVRYLGNPFGPSISDHWRYFIDKDVESDDDFAYVPQDWRAIRIDLDDNPHVDAEATRKRYSSVTNPLQRKAWLLGERTVEGQLFDFKPTITVEEPNLETGQLVQVKKPYHVIDSLPTWSPDGTDANATPITRQPWVTVYRAVDWGFAPDPAVCLWFAVYGRQIVVIHEQQWHRTIAKDVARDIIATTKALLGPNARVASTYADPTMFIKTGADIVSIADTFEMNGVPLEASTNNREQYAHAIHSALQDELMPHVPRITFLSGRHQGPDAPGGCPTLIKVLPQMTYDQKNPLRMADHKHDHLPVALAYMLMSSGVLTSTKPPVVRTRNPYLPVPSSRFTLGRESTRR